MVQSDLERYACGTLLNELIDVDNCKIDIFLTIDTRVFNVTRE